MKNSGLPYLLLVSFLILSQVAGAQTTKGPKKSVPKKPNIILILVDDIGFETIGIDGSASYKTPHIDEMARQGVRFKECYAQPLCSPSRVKIMTGKYNFRNYERWGYLDLNETTFANILKSQGYSTCIAGKWQLKGDQYAPYKAGFDEYLLWQITFTSYNERYKNPRVVENGQLRKYQDGEYGPRLFVNYIKNFMERKKDGPFLVYYPMVLAHRPFVPTPKNGKAYDDFIVKPKGEPGGSHSDTTWFKDEMAYVDENVGEIMDKVRELGISDNTLILLTGDNGTGVEIRSKMNDGSIIPGMKGYTSEYGIHVPLIGYWKGKIKPGQVNSDLVDFSDFLPTLCDAASIKLPSGFVTDGQSFLPLMLGKPYTPRPWLFCHYDPKKGDWVKRRFVHDQEWKLYETGEIYHVSIDPMEKNVIAENDLNEEQKKLIDTFRDVFPKMVKTEVIKKPKEKKKKKLKEEEDD